MRSICSSWVAPARVSARTRSPWVSPIIWAASRIRMCARSRSSGARKRARELTAVRLSLNAPPGPLPIRGAQRALPDLAGVFARQRGAELDAARNHIAGDMRAELIPHGLGGERRALARLYHRDHGFAEFRIGNAEHRAVGDAGKAV